MTETDLIERCRNGELAAFKESFGRYHRVDVKKTDFNACFERVHYV